VVRLSGKDALDLTRSLLLDPSFDPEPNRVILKIIYGHGSREIIDRGLVTYFRSPHSYTGEDVIELSCHGSPPLLLEIINSLLSLGARAAGPGEFTMRALTNGRLNLTQAEAIRDLIDAQTYSAVRHAARQVGGEFSARLQPLKDSLLEMIVPLESSLEFIEEDLPPDITHNLLEKLSALKTHVTRIADTFHRGRLLKEGVKVALIGRPNVGKSSIFNGLLLSDRAIVTDIPGTTRDTLTEAINIEDIPVVITDTAGVRTSADRIEKLGIERTRQAISDADFIIVVIDGSQPISSEDEMLINEASDNFYAVVLNKNDLESFSIQAKNFDYKKHPTISVSAKTGNGINSLRDAIIKPFISKEAHEDFLITNARHYDLLRRTIESLSISEKLIQQHVSEELILVNLYDALRFLGEITGETTSEEILSQIFTTFCIGK
jgi:tRNA modification GTPase